MYVINSHVALVSWWPIVVTLATRDYYILMKILTFVTLKMVLIKVLSLIHYIRSNVVDWKAKLKLIKIFNSFLTLWLTFNIHIKFKYPYLNFSNNFTIKIRIFQISYFHSCNNKNKTKR